MIVNVVDAVIINQSLLAPAESLAEEIPSRAGQPVPDLSRRSDLTWLLWANHCSTLGKNPGSLRYVIDHFVVTDGTLMVMNKFLGNANERLCLWPGYKPTDMQSKEAMAMLGTVHGCGLAFLLADHRGDILKRIRSVTMFTSRSGPTDIEDLLWEFEDTV